MKAKRIKKKSQSRCWAVITDHAVEQFILRWRQQASFKEALNELVSLLETATQVATTPLNDPIFVSGHFPDVRMVIKDNNVCVTVLPKGDDPYDPMSEFLDPLTLEPYEGLFPFIQSIAFNSTFTSSALASNIPLIDEETLHKLQAELSLIEERRQEILQLQDQLHNEYLSLGLAKTRVHNEIQSLFSISKTKR